MTIYIIRPGFTINLFGTIYQGGQSVDLNELQFQVHKHKLEGVESTVEPINPGGNNNNGECCYPAPHLSKVTPAKVLTGQTNTVTIEGSFFTPDTTVECESGNVDNVEFISSNLIRVTITASANVGVYDLIIDNGNQTVESDAIEFFDIPAGLIDLRRGGTPFSAAAIEMRSGMSFTRQTDGLIFAGRNPWGSWARFVGDNDSWVWNRSQKKTVSWICQNTAAHMLGIGSRANNPTSNAQYYQGEILSYSNSGTRLTNLYGNSGNPGSGRTQSFSATKLATDIIKVTLTKNGENGGQFSAYKLPSDSISDWFDTTNKLGEITIAGFGADAPEIMPFCIPRNGTQTKYLGFILENE
ncbi:MAG: IPT/TIG domain-containing protein [Cyanobacteria bacterium J06623_7]